MATVAGTAVDDATGAPLEGVLIDLTMDKGQHLTTLTDVNGHFTIGRVSPCRCEVTATLGGYLPLHYGQRAGDSTGAPIAVPAERRTIELALRLKHGGVITGRVSAPNGQPAVNVVVRAYRREFIPKMGAALTSVAQGTCDDRGQYRMWDLAPGEYVVEAVSKSSVDVAHAIVRTFAPGTASLSDAALVNVRTGEERANVDFTLVDAILVTVSGSLVSSTGGPLTDGHVSLVGEDDREFQFSVDTRRVVTNRNGSFQFTGVIPGRYSLVASGTVAGVEQWASQPISVGSTAVQNVSLVLQAGVDVTGEVVFRGTAPAPLNDNPRVWLMPIGRDTVFVNGVTPYAKVAADAEGHLRFRFNSVPAGRFWISPFSPSTPWQHRDTSIDGRDFTSAAIEVGSEDVSNITISFTDRAPVLTGTVTAADGQAAADAVVILFPADHRAWTAWSPMIRTIRPAADGTIEASNLVPGDYRVAAVMQVEPNAWFDAKYLETLAAVAIPITLSEGLRVTISLHTVSPK